MKIFISGGCKNGKSTLAENCAVSLAAGGPLYYIATMIPYDDEDRARIARHIEARAGKNFITVERGRDIAGLLKECDPDGTYLLDSVTALMSNEMFPGPEPDMDSGGRVAAGLAEFAAGVKHAVFVSDFIYSSAEQYSDLTVEYCRALARCDRTLAEVCDAVAEVCAGTPLMYKGELPV